MARVVLGSELPVKGERRVHAQTLGELLDAIAEAEPGLAGLTLHAYVNGRHARTLDGPDTSVGPEDTVLLTTMGAP